MSIRRITCPNHEEKTASFILYEDGGGHCFGCSYHVKSVQSDLEYSPGEKYVEDLQASLDRIEALPRMVIRGLDLPYDTEAMYIVWPDQSYYKKRFFEPGEGPKYVGAAGHKKTPFSMEVHHRKFLVLVEGELNALSIKEACPLFGVVSPGGSGDFYSKTAESYLTRWSQYANILLIADNDKAGAVATIELKGRLISHNPNVTIHLMEQDANSILEQHGKESLRTYIENLMGVSTQMSGNEKPLSSSGSPSSPTGET